MPAKQDKMVLRNSILGALVGVTANLLLVKHFQCVGSAVVWLLSEATVLLSAQYVVKKEIGIHCPFKDLLKILLLYTPSIIILLLIRCNDNSKYLCNLALGCIPVFINALVVFCYTQPLVVKTIISRFSRRGN
jgi:O-antigen/teichoic acid export membrane protein